MPNSESASFLKSVARYFMDFLETDFHRRRVPRRSIKLKNEAGQLLGVPIDKYPTFDKEIWQVVGRKFDDGGLLNLQRGQYKARIPENLLELIKRQIENLDKESIEAVRTELTKSITNYGASLKDEFTKALELIEKDAGKAVDKNLTNPLIESIEKSLLLLEAADENTAYQIKIELTDLFVAALMPVAETILQSVVLGEDVDVNKKVKATISLRSAKTILTDYFDDLSSNDLYQELAEIDGNRLILDKQELYVYFYDISFQKTTYPLFYISAQTTKNDGIIQLQFDSKVYINKKAVEYIAQEITSDNKAANGNPVDFDRIMYLSAFESTDAFTVKIREIVDRLATFFDLKGDTLELVAERKTARNAKVKITNAAHFALFDKADEALINDYEQILDLDTNSELFAEFEAIVNSFIKDEPEDVGRMVEAEWDEKDSTEKLSFESPVPLNEEQRQVIHALSKENCRFVSVQGPPGTGKSHTITAIVFNAIMQNKSVLVLSDKKEALDVVEDKIADTLNNVRFGTDFQNPILRLGSTNNFRKILSAQAIDSIKLSHKLTGKKLGQLEQSIGTNLEITKEQIRNEIAAYSKLSKGDIFELEQLEDSLAAILKKVETDELIEAGDAEVKLHELRQSYAKLQDLLHPDSEVIRAVARLGLVPVTKLRTMSLSNLTAYTSAMNGLVEHGESVIEELRTSKWLNIFADFPGISDNDLPDLGQYVLRFDALKKPVVGFAFNKTKLNDLVGELNQRFGTSFVDPAADAARVREAHTAFLQLLTLKQHLPLPDAVKNKIDYLSLIGRLLNDETRQAAQNFGSWHDEIQYVIQVTESLPKNFGRTSTASFTDLGRLPLLGLEDIEAERLMRWLHLLDGIKDIAQAAPFYSYQQCMQTIQKQVTLRMAQILDERVIDFYTASRATATVIKDIIKAKQKFPKETFGKLKEAFPCILAGIREYADYIPLEVGIFDLVIIDEASQVSVAQAFPALIRGKKVIVMGDKLQFGNVKSYQARSEINTEYRNRLKEAFTRGVTSEMSALKRIERLDVKKSILDFSEFVSNYQIMLKKHFRSYPENISFSNKYFYDNALQVMKIRGKKIDDVLKFTILEHDGKQEPRPNTNHPEADFILNELRKLAEANDTRNTIGIITPHTNQQRYIFELLRDDPLFDFYVEKLRVKVMTFDTCQGEERDIIYYSMVATEADDKLAYVFPRDIFQSSYDDDSNSEIRRQRLNVGLSRSKETMHFILSKPVESFSGSASIALSHYANLKEEVGKRLTADAVDKKSPMEERVLNWIYETPFWQKNSQLGRCDLRAQFELGAYLKQLDQTYNHPKYVVDFILFYQDEGGRQYKVIFEYDGFEEHFENREMVDQHNYDSYLREEDIYRQKVLESYGYEFVRLNKFNIGTNPVEYINGRIERLLDGSLAASSIGHDIDAIIRGQAAGLSNGELKECQNCGRIIPLAEFKDSTLTTGIGRICKDCKGTKAKVAKPVAQPTGEACPRCGKPLLLRSGRYGKFYGCAGFPYCKYTWNEER